MAARHVGLDRPPGKRGKGREAALTSAAVHALLFAIVVLGALDWLIPRVDEPLDASSKVQVAFVEGGASPGGENAPVGDESLPAPSPPEPSAAEPPTPEPIRPRRPRPLELERLRAPDLPRETVSELLPREVSAVPELDAVDSQALGGVSRRRAPANRPAGEGSGPGRGDRTGPYAPGSYDENPVLVFKPEAPAYPESARERMIAGEVILQVLVKLDGSTEVVSVIKSLPHCVDAAKENARQWRWKPARKDGRPVEAYGIITVRFDIFSSARSDG